MLIIHHVQIDDLDRETAFAISGPPNCSRAAIAARLLAEGRYERVAQIDLRATSHGLETAYAVTQNIEGPGWSRDLPIGLTLLAPGLFVEDGKLWGRRSTMIGDVIEYQGHDGPQQRFVVDWAGFTALPPITTEG
jgi:hypothetical protein